MTPDTNRPSSHPVSSPMRELEDRLRRDAAPERATPPPGLPERMVQAFESRDRAVPTYRRLVFTPSWRAAAAIMVGTAALLGAIANAYHGAGASVPLVADAGHGNEVGVVRDAQSNQAESPWAAPIDGPLIAERQKLDAQIRGSASFLIDRFPHMEIALKK